MREKSDRLFAQGLSVSHIYTMEWLQMLADFALVGGMTLIALLLALMLRSRRDLPQLLLSVVFVNCLAFLLYYYAFLHKASGLAAVAVAFGYGMGWLLGPVLLFYMRSLILPKHQALRGFHVHAIPFAVYWLVVSLPLALNLANGALFADYAQLIADTSEAANIAENLWLLGYCYATVRLLKRMDVAVKANFSSLDSRDLSWCNFLVSGIAAVVIVDTLLSVYEWVFPPEAVVWNIGLVIAILLIGLLAMLGYRGIFQTQLLVPGFLVNPPEDAVHAPAASQRTEGVTSTYHLAALDAGQITQLTSRLEALMHTEKPWLNEGLTLSDLAALLDISDKKLSELLNRHLNTNFYDYVNGFRVACVKERMCDPKSAHLTLLGIALESGFQSKTSFNRVFKQRTGLSPSAYKRQQDELERNALPV